VLPGSFPSIRSRAIPSSTVSWKRLAEFGPNQQQKWRHACFGRTVTTVHLSELRAQLGHAVPADMVVAPMGVAAGSFTRAHPWLPWRGDGDFRIVCCGRLTPGKHQALLVQAVARLRQQGIPAALTLIGSDQSGGQYYARSLEQLVAELDLGGAVRLLGQAAEHEVRAELERAHVFALASLHEGVPVAVMEAMAMALPVVVTDVGGVRDLVADGDDGLLVSAQDLTGMTAALARIAHSPELAQRLGAAASAKVARCFRSDVSARVLADRLRHHLQRPSLSAPPPAKPPTRQEQPRRAPPPRAPAVPANSPLPP
jgi:colanic acid/amylovoran biosynthesis glycosyltransferase